MEMGAPRLDVYRDIHKGVRAMLFGAIRQAGRVDWEDAAEVAALQDTLGGMMVMLRDHVKHEEEHLHPLIERRAPGLVGPLRAEHEAQEAYLDELEAFADGVFEMAADDPMRPRAGQEIYRGLGRFLAMYLPHLDREETTTMRTLWDLSSDEEIAATYGRLIGTMPHDELFESLEIMLPAMNPHDRAELLMGLRAGMSHLYDEAAALAQRVLSEDEWAAVEARIGAG